MPDGDLERRVNLLEGRLDERVRYTEETRARFLIAEERVAGLREDLAEIKSDQRKAAEEIKADLRSSRTLIRSVFITAAVSIVGQILVFVLTQGT